MNDTWKHNRHSNRLKGYDYSRTGAYFVTICVKNRECLFGEIVNDDVILNDMGLIVHNTWANLPNYYKNVKLDSFVIMPNHVHAIIFLCDILGSGIVGAGFKPAPTESIPTGVHGLTEIIRGLKTFSSRQINELRQTQGIAFWQRNFYDHIIKDDKELSAIRNYIENNPRNWSSDEENIFAKL